MFCSGREEVVVDLTYDRDIVDLTGEGQPGLEERPASKREPTAEKNGLCPPRWVTFSSLLSSC